MNVKVEALHVGMNVRQIQYGIGVVKTFTAGDGNHTVVPAIIEIEPPDHMATFTGLEVSLQHLIEQIVHSTIGGFGIKKPDSNFEKCGLRHHGVKAGCFFSK